MVRRFIWCGIVLGLIPFMMGSACGGYVGWPTLGTSGVDAKVTEEVSVFGITPLQSGLWTFYVNYSGSPLGAPGMKTVSTFRDGTAPFGVFTSDGLLEQHFNDHVGVITSTAFDTNGDGAICWIGCPFSGDYTIPDGFCPDVGGTGSTAGSAGFKAYCNKGDWLVLVATTFFEESKQGVSGSRFSNASGIVNPITIGRILASSTPIPGSSGITVTLNALSLPNGASHTLAAPASVNVYGLGHALAVDATQPGLKEAAGWLASQWAGQPDGLTNVTLIVNGGAASGSIGIASGNSAAIALQHYAGQ